MTNHLNEDQLIGYIYQTLADTEREALDLHLSTCPSCRASLDDHETLQRRIHYSVAERRRVAPSSRMSFATIAPHLKRTRRMTRVLKQSNQFIYGALTMALLVAGGIGLYFFVSNLSRPTPTAPEEVKPTVAIGQPETNPTAEVIQPTAEPGSAGELKWKFHGEGNLWGTSAVEEGLVYAGNKDGYLYALDSQTGQETWKFKMKGPADTSVPAIAAGLVYIGSQGQYLYAVDSQTGQEKWNFNTGSRYAHPTAAEGVVYVGAKALHALAGQTGQELWQFALDTPAVERPAVADGVVYVMSKAGYLYAVDAQTGQVKWQFNTKSNTANTPPVAANGLVYVMNYDYLFAVDSQTGQEKWRFEAAEWKPAESSLTVVDGIVYSGSWSGEVFALDGQTGQERWRFKTGGIKARSPAVSAGMVYAGSVDHHLYALDSQTGQEIWKFKTVGAVFDTTVVDGVVYFDSADGYLYAVWAGKPAGE